MPRPGRLPAPARGVASSDEMPAGTGVQKPLRVSELPPDEQAEVRSAMALFHAFAEHQAGAGQGPPRQRSGAVTSRQRNVYAPVADGGHHSGVASARPLCGAGTRRARLLGLSGPWLGFPSIGVSYLPLTFHPASIRASADLKEDGQMKQARFAGEQIISL
jgi:hypothetical protein